MGSLTSLVLPRSPLICCNTSTSVKLFLFPALCLLLFELQDSDDDVQIRDNVVFFGFFEGELEKKLENRKGSVCFPIVESNV